MDGSNSLATQSLEAIIGVPGNALELKWASGGGEPLLPKSRLGYHVAGSAIFSSEPALVGRFLCVISNDSSGIR